IPLRDARRGRARQADRSAPLDRHRAAALLGSRALLRRREAARRRARRFRGPGRADEGLIMQTIAIAVLAALAAGGVIWVFVYPILSGERHAERRQQSVTRTEPAARVAASAGRGPKVRREQVEETLKELEIRQKKLKNLPLP